MIENFDEFYSILAQVSLIFGIFYFIYKKFIFSFFDPLLFYILIQAFSVEMGIILIQDTGYLLSFIFCQLFFAIGFSCVSRSTKKNQIIDDSGLEFKANEYKFLTYFTFFGFLIVLVANIYLISVQGVILFLDDPTTGKVAAFEGGGGIGAIRRINWGLLNLLNVTTLLLYVKTKKKIFLFMLIVLVLINLSGGSKSSLLIYVLILAFLGQFKSISELQAFKRIDKLKMPFLGGCVIVATLIIAADSNGIQESLMSLGVRFLYFGDILFYYYNTDAVNHFQKLGVIDFLNYELNPLLGLLRLTPYLSPLSFEMVQYSFSHGEVLDNVVGPNLPHYVKGHIFFGKFGALIYSFLVGVFIAFVRNQLFKKHYSYIKYIILVFLNLSIFSFAQDSALTISVFIDTIVFSLAPFFLALILIYSPYKIIK